MKIGFNLLGDMSENEPRLIKDFCKTESGFEAVFFSIKRHKKRKIEVSSYYPSVFSNPENTRSSWLFEELNLPFEIQKSKVDIFVSPFMHLPLRQPCKTIALMQDPSPLMFSDQKAAGFEGYIHSKAKLRSAKKANRIITASGASKKELAKLLCIKPDKIGPVNLYAGKDYYPVFDTSLIESAKQRFNIHGQYFIYCGDYFKRNNISELMVLFKSFSAGNKKYKLVLASKNKIGTALPSDERIIIVENINNDVLRCLYSGALAFITTSSFESFPLSALEALACSTPAVAYDNSSFREALGSAEVLVKEGDKTSFCAAMKSLSEDNGMRIKIKAASLERSKILCAKLASDTLAKILKEVYFDSYTPDAKQ